jgi:hypothetical protein
MIDPTIDEEAVAFFIALLNQKNVKVRFHSPHRGGMMWDVPEVYAVDQPMSFSREELTPIQDFLCMRDSKQFNAGNLEYFSHARSIAFQNWTEFEYLPDAFMPESP